MPMPMPMPTTSSRSSVHLQQVPGPPLGHPPLVGPNVTPLTNGASEPPVTNGNGALNAVSTSTAAGTANGTPGVNPTSASNGVEETMPSGWEMRYDVYGRRFVKILFAYSFKLCHFGNLVLPLKMIFYFKQK